MTNATQPEAHGHPAPTPSVHPEYPPREGSATLRTAVLVVSVVTTGLLAGVFADWSNAIMPGLAEVDDRTLVEAFQALDAAITSPAFLLAFMGAPVLIGVAAALHLRPGDRAALPWIGVALGCCLVVLAITFAVHEPLNVELRDAGDLATPADLAAARERLDEARWTAWNTVRAVAATLACGCLAVAIRPGRRPSS